jgi:hypothetical protein
MSQKNRRFLTFDSPDEVPESFKGYFELMGNAHRFWSYGQGYYRQGDLVYHRRKLLGQFVDVKSKLKEALKCEKTKDSPGLHSSVLLQLSLF